MSYFARFQITSSTVPIWEAGLVYRRSSAVIELMIRFWEPPFKFGSDAVSMFVVSVFVASSIDHVPKWAVIPWIAALASSALAWFGLAEANFGRSDLKIMNENRPFASNTANPLGFGPQRASERMPRRLRIYIPIFRR
jgi:hypothetical protein